MSDVASMAQAALDAVNIVFEKKKEELNTRAEQLRRIKTQASDASEDSTTEALDDAMSYINSLGVSVEVT